MLAYAAKSEIGSMTDSSLMKKGMNISTRRNKGSVRSKCTHNEFRHGTSKIINCECMETNSQSYAWVNDIW